MCKVCHEPLLQIDRLLENLHRNERTGSKPRCHWLTHGAPGQVASRLNALAEPWGSVSVDDLWMPEGFSRIEKAQLDKAGRLLPKQDRDRLRRWWLAVSRRNTRTPTWDIASTCTVDGHKGLLLIEAKAHTQELKVQDQVEASLRNRERIAECIEEANAALADWTGLYWSLSHEHRYQRESSRCRSEGATSPAPTPWARSQPRSTGKGTLRLTALEEAPVDATGDSGGVRCTLTAMPPHIGAQMGADRVELAGSRCGLCLLSCSLFRRVHPVSRRQWPNSPL